jgi:hypothetical protein
MTQTSSTAKEKALSALRDHGAMPCPFCGAEGKELICSEEGPQVQMYDGALDSEPTEARHLVYCPAEDRNFYVVYSLAGELPECTECQSNFDVIGLPPENQFSLVSEFSGAAECQLCGEEVGRATFRATDIVDGGHLGN